jgi:type III secretion protein U
MSEQKTEQPTRKKLQDARKKGEIAYSRDFVQTVLVVAMLFYLIAGAAAILDPLGALIVASAWDGRGDFGDTLRATLDLSVHTGLRILAPFIGIVLLAGLLVDFLQVGPLLAFERVAPKMERLAPSKNAKNIFSVRNVVEFLKSTAKVVLLAVLVAWVLRTELPNLLRIGDGGLASFQAVTGVSFRRLAISVAVVYAAIALADLLWQRKQFRRQQMMGKNEVRQEFKNTEGDPQIKHRRKGLHRELLMENLVGSVRNSSVVVTNPTHLAVALRYEKGDTPLPMVMAKGRGRLAALIVRSARQAGVPVMQDVPLARALMETAHPEDFIPAELIEPVAHVLRWVRDRQAALTSEETSS